MKSIFLFALLSFAVTACDRNDGPPLEITDATVFAPLPGTRVSVAYMSIRNNTQADIVIGSIRSPQFASVRMHETRIVDGIAKMTTVETVPPMDRNDRPRSTSMATYISGVRTAKSCSVCSVKA